MFNWFNKSGRPEKGEPAIDIEKPSLDHVLEVLDGIIITSRRVRPYFNYLRRLENPSCRLLAEGERVDFHVAMWNYCRLCEKHLEHFKESNNV